MEFKGLTAVEGASERKGCTVHTHRCEFENLEDYMTLCKDAVASFFRFLRPFTNGRVSICAIVLRINYTRVFTIDSKPLRLSMWHEERVKRTVNRLVAEGRVCDMIALLKVDAESRRLAVYDVVLPLFWGQTEALRRLVKRQFTVTDHVVDLQPRSPVYEDPRLPCFVGYVGRSMFVMNSDARRLPAIPDTSFARPVASLPAPMVPNVRRETLSYLHARVHNLFFNTQCESQWSERQSLCVHKTMRSRMRAVSRQRATHQKALAKVAIDAGDSERGTDVLDAITAFSRATLDNRQDTALALFPWLSDLSMSPAGMRTVYKLGELIGRLHRSDVSYYQFYAAAMTEHSLPGSLARRGVDVPRSSLLPLLPPVERVQETQHWEVALRRLHHILGVSTHGVVPLDRDVVARELTRAFPHDAMLTETIRRRMSPQCRVDVPWPQSDSLWHAQEIMPLALASALYVSPLTGRPSSVAVFVLACETRRLVVRYAGLHHHAHTPLDDVDMDDMAEVLKDHGDTDRVEWQAPAAVSFCRQTLHELLLDLGKRVHAIGVDADALATLKDELFPAAVSIAEVADIEDIVPNTRASVDVAWPPCVMQFSNWDDVKEWPKGDIRRSLWAASAFVSTEQRRYVIPCRQLAFRQMCKCTRFNAADPARCARQFARGTRWLVPVQATSPTTMRALAHTRAALMGLAVFVGHMSGSVPRAAAERNSAEDSASDDDDDEKHED